MSDGECYIPINPERKIRSWKIWNEVKDHLNERSHSTEVFLCPREEPYNPDFSTAGWWWKCNREHEIALSEDGPFNSYAEAHEAAVAHVKLENPL